jgi:hypothetical protein
VVVGGGGGGSGRGGEVIVLSYKSKNLNLEAKTPKLGDLLLILKLGSKGT